MEIRDLYFTPHSDTGANDLDIIERHNDLIENGQYDEAVTLLDAEAFEKGVRASLLNSIQNKIRQLQLYLLNEFNPDKETYYSDTEPDTTFMDANGYKFWAKPY